MHFDPSYMVNRKSPSASWPHLVDANAYATPGQYPVGQATQALTANRLYIFPFFLPIPIAITEAAIVVETVSVGDEAKLALFNWDQENKEVRSLVGHYDTALDVGSGTGEVSNSTDFPVVLEPGWYAWGLVSDGTPTLQLINVDDPMLKGNLDISSTDWVAVSYYYADGTGMFAGGITDPGDYSDLTEVTGFNVVQAVACKFNLNPAVPA